MSRANAQTATSDWSSDVAPAAFAVLAAIVVQGECTDRDVDVERGVILDEIAARDDDPEDLAGEIALQATIPLHPLGRSVLGTADDVASLRAETLRALHGRSLDPARMVVAEVGPRRHEDVVGDVVNSPLANLRPAPAVQRHAEAAFASPRLQPVPGDLIGLRVPGQQVHLCLSVLTPARDDALRAAAHVAGAALGGSVSSRLFQRVRERLGIAYNVFGGVDQFGPAGVLQVGASAPSTEAPRLLTSVAEEILAFGAAPASRAEIERAAAFLRGGIVLSRDDPMARMTRAGRHVLERGTVSSLEQAYARLAAVNPDAVAEVWQKITEPGWQAVVVGPLRGRAARRATAPLAALTGADTGAR